MGKKTISTILALMFLMPITAYAQSSYMSAPAYNIVNMASQQVYQMAQMGQISNTSSRDDFYGTRLNIPRGAMSAREYVETVLNEMDLPYKNALSDVPVGRVGVIDNRNGRILHISPRYFDQIKFTWL